VRRLVLALQFLTRLPLPNVRAEAADFAAAMRWFPVAGLVVGLIVSGASWAGAQIDPWTGALAGLVAWVAVTGALHLDGLADLADGLGAAHGDRGRLLTVMADPHIGSFGVVAIAAQLLAKTILLHGLIAIGPIWPLILLPFAARIGPLAWTRWLPPLHAGLAARFSGAVRGIDIGLWTALLLASALLWPAMLAAPVLIAAFAFWLNRKVGGISGDGHGAGIELVETGLLLASLIAWRF
jgi:adenosylcobinamide-GDP ribazoletransferase